MYSVFKLATIPGLILRKQGFMKDKNFISYNLLTHTNSHTYKQINQYVCYDLQ